MKNLKLILALFLLTQLCFGQERKVYGVVRDNLGEQIPGANVIIKGTYKGTSTDIDGKYSINAKSTDTLTYSYAGMKIKKTRADKEEINIQLEEDEVQLITVLPYEPNIHLKRKDLSSISTITLKELKTSKKKLNNPRYNFKKNANNNIFLIFVSELKTYNFEKEDLEFQQKYNVKYALIGSYKINYLTKYNKLTFKFLDKKYNKTWQNEIRKDAVGLDKYLK